MKPAIVPIVEGQAEVQAVPVLLRRILDVLEAYHVQIARPFRVGRCKVVKKGELERAIQYAMKDRENVEAILIVLDADDDCPAELGPDLARRVEMVAAGKPFAVVLAKRELEAWFLGAKRSLRGVRGMRPDAESPPEPEGIRGAKEALSRNMAGKRYLGIDDQPALAAAMDLEAAQRRCASFDKLMRDVARLVAEVSRPESGN